MTTAEALDTVRKFGYSNKLDSLWNTLIAMEDEFSELSTMQQEAYYILMNTPFNYSMYL